MTLPCIKCPGICLSIEFAVAKLNDILYSQSDLNTLKSMAVQIMFNPFHQPVLSCFLCMMFNNYHVKYKIYKEIYFPKMTTVIVTRSMHKTLLALSCYQLDLKNSFIEFHSCMGNHYHNSNILYHCCLTKMHC